MPSLPWLQIENFGALRYERSRLDSLNQGPSLTQMHEASNVEVAVLEGQRPLIVSKEDEWTCDWTPCRD